MATFRLPDDSQHLTIYGMNGSGKTYAALYHLSLRDFITKPWVIFNFKKDEQIDAIPYHKILPVGELPVEPGIWVTHPKPVTDDSAVEDMFRGIWERGHMGVYIDEGYMVPKRSAAFDALLTQGRSKRIPIITLTQRPKWMTKFVISEATFHQVFFLSSENDRESVEEFIPHDMSERLPRFHSYYYDVGLDEFTGLKPVPHISQIFATIEEKLRPPETEPALKTRRFL